MSNGQTNVSSRNVTNRQFPPAQASTIHVGSQDSILQQTAQVLIRDNTTKNKFAHLQDIELADSNHRNEELQNQFTRWSQFHVVIFHWHDKGPVASFTILGRVQFPAKERSHDFQVLVIPHDMLNMFY